MKFGIHLGSVNMKHWADTVVAAEQFGFDSVWVPEHLVVPLAAAGSPHHGSDHPPIPSAIPMLDALGVLCHLAARTEHIRLGTNVYNIGLRHPFATARAAVTVDYLSGGRLDLGIGASWLRAEWDAVGLDFDTRGARVDETIEVCLRLWSEPEIEHHGRFFDFAPTAFEPKPVQKPLPLHVGGDGPAALRRAATMGTGWMPMNHTLGDLPVSISRLTALADQAGRPVPEVTMPVDIATSDDVEAARAAGLNQVIVRPWTRSAEAVDAMGRFSERFLSGR